MGLDINMGGTTLDGNLGEMDSEQLGSDKEGMGLYSNVGEMEFDFKQISSIYSDINAYADVLSVTCEIEIIKLMFYRVMRG